MQFSKENIINLLKKACDLVIENDTALLEINISERALTHRLGVYLERFLTQENKDNNYFVDCEYNRDGFAEKAIRYDDDNEDSSIFPDIIVHQRCSIGNILIIEAKKNAIKRNLNSHKDTKKLIQYCREYEYKYAFFLNFLTNEEKIEIYLLNQENWMLEIK